MKTNLLLRHRIPAGGNLFHHATADPYQHFCALEGELHADVCIVGGGLTGVSAALHLAKNGISVALLEAQKIGCGASGRNGGHIANGFSCELKTMEKMLGFETTKMLWQMVDSYLVNMDENIHEHDIQCDRKFGYIYAANNSYQMRELASLNDRLKLKYDYQKTTLLNKADLGNFLKTTRYSGGLFDKTCGQINPLKYLQGLVRQLKTVNVKIFEQSPAKAISQGPNITVHSEKGRIKSKFVVLAGNAYLNCKTPPLYNKSIPVSSFVGVTSPLSRASIQSILPRNVTVADCNKIPDYYQIVAGNRILFGCGINFLGKEPKDLKKVISNKIKRVFPQLTSFELDYAWSGLISSTINKLPHIGQINSQIYYAQGFSGHGVVLSGLTGKLISRAIMGDSNDFKLFSSIHHKELPPHPIKNIGLGIADFCNTVRQNF